MPCWRVAKVVALSALFMTMVVLPVTSQAQEETPKSELFLGYQWSDPGGKIPLAFQPVNNPVGVEPPSMPKGFGATYTYNFTPIFGVSGDLGHNWHDFGYNTTLSVGPRVTWRQEHTNLFAHAMLSYNRFVESGLDPSNGVGGIFGGGMDLKATRALSIRIFEADYVIGFQRFPDAVPTTSDLHSPIMNGARLRAGVVFNWGGEPTIPPTASCSVDHNEVMVGEPITATVSTANFNPKHTLTYNWTSNGGAITGKDTTAAIDTKGLAGGSYTVTARVSDPKMKKGGEVSCSANFTVKEPPKNPPTMSCSANPSSVQAGTDVTVSCQCTSPDNVGVTVAGWTSTGGSLSGSGNTATLSTSGASSGPITVNATCTDARGLTASASTQVTIENPPPPPPQASKLSECDFPNPVKPWRVDNTCKAILDDVALRLQRDADATLVIVGNAEPTEKRKNLAGERALNSKAYLTGGEAKQGIDPSRISVQTGSAGTKTAEYWVVPAGATFTGEGTQPVDETKVKPVPDHPARRR